MPSAHHVGLPGTETPNSYQRDQSQTSSWSSSFSVPPRQSSLRPWSHSSADMTTMTAPSFMSSHPYYHGAPSESASNQWNPNVPMGYQVPPAISSQMAMNPEQFQPNPGHRRVETGSSFASTMSDRSLHSLQSNEIPQDVGLWHQHSPRNLKRPGDETWDQGHLRRPASFPAMPATSEMNEEVRFAHQVSLPPSQQPQPPSLSRAQTLHRIPLAGNRTGLGDALGLKPMTSAHELRQSYSNSTITHAENYSPENKMIKTDVPHTPSSRAGEVTPSFSTISTLPSNSPSSSTHRRSGGMASTWNSIVNQVDDYQGKPLEAQQVYPGQAALSELPTLRRSSHSTILSRGSQEYGASTSRTADQSVSTSKPQPVLQSPRAQLQIHGNLHDMALGWSHEEWRLRRRLVQFWRKQEGTTIHAICKPIQQEEYVPNSVVVSCIFWDVTNECYITSVDIIYLLEALVASRFNVEEKNRIRRNLEGLKPKTIVKQPKTSDENLNQIQDEFFKLVMSFPMPKPRHIEKDIKIFPWKVLETALNKIIGKYSATPLMANYMEQPTIPPSMPYMAPPLGMRNSEELSQYSTPQPPQGQFAQPPPANRRAPGGLSIDVAASNSMQTYGGNFQQKSENGSSPVFSLPVPSPRRLPNSSSTPGSAFNINDYVISPSTFSHGPLQQAQLQGPEGISVPSHGQGGLGMDLGVKKEHYS